MEKNLKLLNDMVDRVFLELWQRKTRGHMLEDVYFKNFSIRRFSIDEICEGISRRECLSDTSIGRVSAILSDLKLLFYFLGNTVDYFYVGTAKIVGNSNFQEVGLNTLSLLQRNHYKVFLISGIYERILDLLELINFDEISDVKRDKWGKKYEKLSQIETFSIISPAEHKKMIAFRDRIRRAEIHGLSSVFRQLKAEKWDHFQEEENLLRDLLLRISDEYK
ncbi:MAG: hypothetical protein ABSE95_14905 [Thermodesulfobacteriota bacterium]|jgi:hypothetical protein